MRQFKDFADVRIDFNKRLATTLFYLFKQQGFSQETLCNLFQEKYGVELNSGSVSSYKNKASTNIPPVVLMEACKLLGITMDELFAQAAQDFVRTDSPGEAAALSNPLQQMRIAIPASEKLISDPENAVFRGYWGNYHIYFTPTFSSGCGVLQGRLTLQSLNGEAHAVLEITTDQNGNAVMKRYEGTLVQSTAMDCCYCILSSSDVGELCFLMFRHFHLNNNQLECRLAEALTASAGGEDRYPTVHRLLISREPIQMEDLRSLLPLLNLNNSQITISDKALDEISQMNQEYAAVIARILSTPGLEPMTCYQIREDTLRTTARDMRLTQAASPIPLIIAIRARAIAYRYNKISHKADQTVRDYLKQRGYFQ